jgi:murein DD-endopeptidase MepM/ murein hydrolase activator NlpD
MINLFPPVDGLLAILSRQKSSGHGQAWRWGRRVHPRTGEPNSYHDGIDLGAPDGDPIRAVANGVVGGTGDAQAGGKWLRILHDSTIYPIAQSGHCHLSAYAPGLTVGKEVKRGEVVAYVGYTGGVQPPGPAGAHLHFQLWVRSTDGHMADIDPLPLLEACVVEEQIPFGGTEEIV